MSRGLPQSYVDALNSGYWRPVLFAELHYLPSGVLYLHDQIGPVIWGGNTWQGIGAFGGISAVEEGSVVSPYKIELSLSGVDLTLAPEILTGKFDQQQVVLFLGMLSPLGQFLLGHSGTAQAGASSTITLASTASALNDAYNGQTIRLLSGAGIGQTGVILDYAGASRVATMTTSWTVNPNNTTTYSVDDTPYHLWEGKADVPTIIKDAELATIQLRCESELAAFDRSSALLFSEPEIKKRYPTDTFFRYMPAMQERVIVWQESKSGRPGVPQPIPFRPG